MNRDLPVVNSHNSWSQLEEVWLGDVYPASWYDHLAPDVRDVFHELTRITQEDLSVIQKTIESFGIQVRRPEYANINSFIDIHTGQLLKPQICPRDHFVTIGNTLMVPGSYTLTQPWVSALNDYSKDPGSIIMAGTNHVIHGANVVRVGRDIIIDTDIFDVDPVWSNLASLKNYRTMWVKNGGHMDGCFAILKPGLIIANHYFSDYERTFPGWKIIMLNNPTYGAAPSTGYRQPYPVANGKFYNTTVGTNQSFNEHIIQHALDWVGNYQETYFELNCLVVNEKNVIMLGYNDVIEKELAEHDITVHWVPFRARSFWDGAMHCLTVDIRRQSTIEDFFPERGQCQQ